MKYDVITVGGATQDVFLLTREWKEDLGEKRITANRGEAFHLGSKSELAGITFDTGGGATNAAVTFARAGFRVGTVTRVGQDPAGGHVIDALKSNRVDTRHIVCTAKESTGYSSILLTKNGERTVLVYRGASHDFHWNETPWSSIQTRWLYLTSLAGDREYIVKLMRWAKAQNVRVAWNPGKAELEWGLASLARFAPPVSVLILNKEEAAMLTGGDVGAMPFPIIVVTDGIRGASVFSADGRWHGPSIGPKAKNATGAGDAFGSAFTAGMMQWNDPIMALRLGLYNSGSVVAQMGAKTGIMKKIPEQSILKRIRVIEH